MLQGYIRVIKLQMKINQQLMDNLFNFLIRRVQCNIPKCLHA